jgi:hypothetical protein
MEEEIYHRYTDEEKIEKIDAMVETRFRERIPWDQVCEKHGVSRKTAYRWRQTEDWLIAEGKWRRILREEARTNIHETANDMIGILQDLAHGIPAANGERIGSFTRFSAAKTLLEMVGVDNEVAEKQLDQNDQFLDFLKKLKIGGGGQAPPTMLAEEVRPGGLLPASVVESTKEMIKKRLEEDDDIDGEFVEITENPSV